MYLSLSADLEQLQKVLQISLILFIQVTAKDNPFTCNLEVSVPSPPVYPRRTKILLLGKSLPFYH